MRDGCKGRCYREMQGYSAHCTRCREEQIKEGILQKDVRDYVYFGETSRSLMTRAAAHIQDYQSHQPGSRRKPVSSWMWDHSVNCHAGVISPNPADDYQFRVQGSFRDCLSRQLDEAVRIMMVENHGRVVGDRGEGVGGVIVMLNRKEEFYQPKTVQCNFFN
jgi:hypothetical protein